MNALAMLNIDEQTDEYFEHLFNELIHYKIKKESVTEPLKLPVINELHDLTEEEVREKIQFLDDNKENFINYTNYLLLKAILSDIQINTDDALRYIKQAKQLETENPFWDFIDIILRSGFEVDVFNLSIIEDIPLIRQNPYADKIISFIRKCQQLDKNVSSDTLINNMIELQKEADPKFIQLSSTLAAIASTNRNSAFNEIPDIISPEFADNEQLKALIDRGIQSNSDNEPLWHIFNAWQSLHDENYNQAKKIFQWIKNETDEINNFDPTLHWACIGLYKVYIKMGDEHSAMKALEEYLYLIHLFGDMKTLETDLDFPALSPEQTNLILYEFYKKQGDHSTALSKVMEIRDYHWRLDSKLNYATMIRMIADTLYLLESYDESLYYYYRCLDLDPSNENIKKRIKELSSITLRSEDYFKRYPTNKMKEQFLKLAKIHFNSFNEAICKFFPFSENLLKDLQHKLDWNSISSNRAILWNLDLIRSYHNHLNFSRLSKNPSLPWDKDLLLKFRDKWDWEALSSNTGIIWTKELMRQFREYLHFTGNLHSISENVSVLWSEEILDEFEKLLDWKSISGNTNIPWSKELIEKYEDKWHWEELSGNPSIPWDHQLIGKYMECWAWEALSLNEGVKFNSFMLKNFEDNWHWDALMANENFPCKKHIIENFKHKIPEGKIRNHEKMSIYHGIKNIHQNPKIIVDTSSYFYPYYNTEFIVKYFDYVDFERKNIVVDEDMYPAIKKHYGIEALKKKSDIITFEHNVLVKYKNELDWDKISQNKNYNWSLNFISEFSDCIDIDDLFPQIIEKVCFPYLDEETVLEFYKGYK